MSQTTDYVWLENNDFINLRIEPWLARFDVTNSKDQDKLCQIWHIYRKSTRHDDVTQDKHERRSLFKHTAIPAIQETEFFETDLILDKAR